MNTQLDNKRQLEVSIQDWLATWIADRLNLDAETIDVSKSFLNYSTDSVTAMMLVGDLEDWLNLSLSPTLVWDYSSLLELTQYLAQQIEGIPLNGRKDLSSARIELEKPETLLAQLDSLSEQEMNLLLEKLLADEKKSA